MILIVYFNNSITNTPTYQYKNKCYSKKIHCTIDNVIINCAIKMEVILDNLKIVFEFHLYLNIVKNISLKVVSFEILLKTFS